MRMTPRAGAPSTPRRAISPAGAIGSWPALPAGRARSRRAGGRRLVVVAGQQPRRATGHEQHTSPSRMAPPRRELGSALRARARARGWRGLAARAAPWRRGRRRRGPVGRRRAGAGAAIGASAAAHLLRPGARGRRAGQQRLGAGRRPGRAGDRRAARPGRRAAPRRAGRAPRARRAPARGRRRARCPAARPARRRSVPGRARAATTARWSGARRSRGDTAGGATGGEG